MMHLWPGARSLTQMMPSVSLETARMLYRIIVFLFFVSALSAFVLGIGAYKKEHTTPALILGIVELLLYILRFLPFWLYSG